MSSRKYIKFKFSYELTRVINKDEWIQQRKNYRQELEQLILTKVLKEGSPFKIKFIQIQWKQQWIAISTQSTDNALLIYAGLGLESLKNRVLKD